MKRLMIIAVVIIITMSMIACCKTPKPGKVNLKTFADSLSYALGHIYGSDIADVDFDFNMNFIFKGIVNAKDPKLAILSEEQMSNLFNRFHEMMSSKNFQENEQVRLKNKTEGISFMAMNADDPDVFNHESGIQYKVIKKGTGKKIKDGDTVTANYTGKFLDGRVFDSSYDRGEPMTFDTSLVIKGWSEALKLMRVGDVFELVIPDSLAYGDMGYEMVEPGAYLIFEIEVVAVK